MARQALLSLGTRFSAGHGLWSIAAFLFPSLAIANGESLSIAMGLFLLETVAAIAILSARLGVSWLASRGDPDARARMGQVVHGLKGVLLTGIIGVGWGLALALASLQAEPAGVAWAPFADRASWMLGTLLATAVLDSIVAPVRTPVWLETNLRVAGEPVQRHRRLGAGRPPDRAVPAFDGWLLLVVPRVTVTG